MKIDIEEMKTLWLSMEGRASCHDMLMKTVVPVIVLSVIINILGGILTAIFAPLGLIASLASLALMWPSVVVSLKRAKDMDRDWKYLIWLLIPILGLWRLYELCTIKGTAGDNQYGADPLAS